MADTCPLLTLQPVLEGEGARGALLQAIGRFPAGYAKAEPAATGASGPRTLQHNFMQIEEWTRAMCAYVQTLELRIKQLEGP